MDTLVSIVVLSSVFWILWKVFHDYLVTYPFDNLPGPPPTSFILGSARELGSRQAWKEWASLAQTYGPVSVVLSFLRMRLIVVHDPKVLYAVFVKEQESFPKNNSPSNILKILLGPGVFAIVDKADHRRQRKLLNPVFAPSHLREMSRIFYSVAHKVKSAIQSRLPTDGTAGVLDMNGWNSRTTLEMLGQAGLGYSFDDFSGECSDAYGESLKMFFPALEGIGVAGLLVQYASRFFSDRVLRKILQKIPLARVQKVVAISDTMVRRSQEIINERKRALLSEGNGALDHQAGGGKDIMSICLKANMAASANEKMSDEEILAQMSTFILAGMDTTSNALSRILALLAEHPLVQEKLRSELLEATHGGATDLDFDDLMKLPYLDAVIRETLRARSPVTLTIRSTARDIALPLSHPVRGRDGSMIHELVIPRGTHILPHIQASNCNKELWGEDADEWKPERWLAPLPAAVEEAHLPSVYSNILTFSAGPRSCIGFKFSELEMKIYLSVLLTRFAFELTDQTITWNSSSVNYPTMGEESTKPEMLLKVRLL